jgi:hypothetical protein
MGLLTMSELIKNIIAGCQREELFELKFCDKALLAFLEKVSPHPHHQNGSTFNSWMKEEK